MPKFNEHLRSDEYLESLALIDSDYADPLDRHVNTIALQKKYQQLAESAQDWKILIYLTIKSKFYSKALKLF